MLKWIQNSIIGLLIGLSSSYIILTLSLLSNNRMISGESLLEQLMIAGIMGIVIGWGGMIYSLEKYPFVILTIIHYLFVVCCVLVAGTIGNWFQWSDTSTVFSVILTQFITYIIIWAIVYILEKRDVNKLNTLIQERRNSYGKHH